MMTPGGITLAYFWTFPSFAVLGALLHAITIYRIYFGSSTCILCLFGHVGRRVVFCRTWHMFLEADLSGLDLAILLE